jgi:excisionase family DNA binding protein
MNLIDEQLRQRIMTKKTRLDNHRPLNSTLIKKLHENMEIAYTYNSNAIEGNTLTLKETQLVIEEGITVNGKSLSEHLEAQNHPKAIAYIESVVKNKIEEQNILKLHSILFTGFCENAGNYRNSQVYITGSDFTPPPAFEVPDLMRSLIDWVSNNPEELRPIELAAIFHHKLVYIHPFDDGNGRIGRLLMNLLLMKNGYPLTVIKQVDRKKYYETLKKADAGNYKPLVNFIARCVEQSLDLYLQAVEPSEPKNKLLTLEEASKTTPYSQEYLSLLARQGRIGAVKIGRNWKITQNELQEYLSKQQKTAGNHKQSDYNS